MPKDLSRCLLGVLTDRDAHADHLQASLVSDPIGRFIHSCHTFCRLTEPSRAQLEVSKPLRQRSRLV